MKTLVLVRHAEASRDNVTLPDSERPLTARGRREAAAAVAAFQTLGRSVDRIVTSPSRRAADTADIWLKTLKLPERRLRTEAGIYEAERADLLSVVRSLHDGDNTVVLVGHNPGVTAVLHYLVGRGIETMFTAAFAVISIDVDRWSRVALRDSELVLDYRPPADAKFNSVWQRFVLWQRQRAPKIELLAAVLIGLVLILGVVTFVFMLQIGE